MSSHFLKNVFILCIPFYIVVAENFSLVWPLDFSIISNEGMLEINAPPSTILFVCLDFGDVQCIESSSAGKI